MSMINTPLVSVLMPIYNVEKYLAECIESVLSQTYSNFELILVDDGSTDKCSEIVDEFSDKDHRVIAIHQENAGVDAARNNAIKHANGKYIAFIDSDDKYEPRYLETMVNEAESNDYQLVTCSFIPFGVTNPPKFKVISEQVTDRDTAAEYLLGYNSVNGYVWNKLFTKEIIDQNNIWFEDGYWACDDVLFAGNYLYHCTKVKILEAPLYRYRQVATGANRVRYSGVPFQKKWMSSFKVTGHFRELYCSDKVTRACNLHEVREAGIVLRAMAASNYSGEEYKQLTDIVKKYKSEFLKDGDSSYFQKLSVVLTSISPKLELTVWRMRNK
ncbi:MAG: glycosyltransferase [Lachnospiraceae bacterium]|nr:MAG: glycosyltransferase [Lachnospiraceae bacterium]